MTSNEFVKASFRDPAGRVFEENGDFFRTVTPAGYADYSCFIQSHLADELCRQQKLIPFEEIETRGDNLILRLERLPFVSYPYEWCFQQLRDAALLTLDVQLEALECGMSLKDASAFNVGWRGGCPIFIDHGSFTAYEQNQPWCAYRQFIRHFLGPLLLMSRVAPECAGLLRSNLDGIPLELISRALPRRTWLELGPLLHIHLHARMEKRYSDSHATRVPSPTLSLRKLLGMIRYLRELIAALKAPQLDTEWADYYSDTNYSEDSSDDKTLIVKRFVEHFKGKRILDFGANCGRYSFLAASCAAEVIASDRDHSAIQRLYDAIRGQKDANLYPILQDLSNPSPGIGLFNEERMPFLQRATADASLGLALIHHLRIGDNWPLDSIVRLFAEAAPAALVEFVPKSDSQVRRLLRSRRDICTDWSLDEVCHAFEKRFRRCIRVPVLGTDRVMLDLSERIG